MTETPDRNIPTGNAQLRNRFIQFYEELRGQTPYSWQQRLATELSGEYLYDELIAPTGAGKTSVLECFLFALAHQLENALRTLPLRLFWVIDRRSVIDQIFARVEEVAAALANPSTGSETERVASALSMPHGQGDGNNPIEVRRWRGGTGRGVETLPLAVPAIICSTVDQVGSRMLFRGYGTSHRSRPIDAALVATDSLIVLDEAHLSQPFAETSDSVRETQERAESPTPRPLHVMRVSATPAVRSDDVRRFELTSEELAEEPLARRVRARKSARLTKKSRVVDGLIRGAKSLGNDAQVVGVVANTVSDARAVYAQLAADGEAILVIGPSRPLERDAVLREIPNRDHPSRAARKSPLFVVGTQTLEVGLDLDFDALATACAPFPALVQRFGRLDRTGKVTEARGHAPAVIVSSREDCPVYGDAVGETWAWLESRLEDDEIDLGPQAIPAHVKARPPEPPPEPQAPILGPWHVEVLSQTNEDPIPTPEISLFLHGERSRSEADVSIAWRGDLRGGDPSIWKEHVRARPPHSGELLSLPVWTVRRWLDGQLRPPPFGDIESAEAPPAGESGDSGGASRDRIPYLRVLPPGPDGQWQTDVPSDSSKLKPGDVIVVPSSAGGCDRFGWAPASSEHVTDLGDLNPIRSRVLVADIGSTLGLLPEGLANKREAVLTDLLAEDIDAREAYVLLLPAVKEWLSCSGQFQDERAAVANSLQDTGMLIVLEAEGTQLPILTSSSPRDKKQPREIEYRTHAADVERLAMAYTSAQGLTDELVQTIRLAARYHDIGKLDPRFQAWLNGGITADPAKPLAKSSISPRDRRSEANRRAAGWPRGKRHEMTSAVLAREAARMGAIDGCDTDLLVYLIVTHHGQHRPFLPAKDEPDTEPISISTEVEGASVSASSSEGLEFSEHASHFCTLNRRYGPWGLAALEATLVVADRIASAEADD